MLPGSAQKGVYQATQRSRLIFIFVKAGFLVTLCLKACDMMSQSNKHFIFTVTFLLFDFSSHMSSSDLFFRFIPIHIILY